jgi:hypothetical protein
MDLLLIRHAYLPDVTLGRLHVAGVVMCTLEEAWRPDPDGPGGQRREGSLVESCIPDGDYILEPHSSPRYPEEQGRGVWYIENPYLGVYAPGKRPAGQTWGRDAILIHSGNTTDHIEGCILVGASHGTLNGKPAVLDSVRTLARLREILGRTDTHRLVIRPIAGTSEAVH